MITFIKILFGIKEQLVFRCNVYCGLITALDGVSWHSRCSLFVLLSILRTVFVAIMLVAVLIINITRFSQTAAGVVSTILDIS